MTDIELGWLVGLIDGEGCINLSRARGRGAIRPVVQITNTNMDLMQKAQQLFSELTGQTPSICVQSSKGKLGYLTCYRIQIRKHSSVANILDKIIPHLVAKKAQAELVLEFVNRRLSTPRRPRLRVKGGQDRPYQPEELALLEKVQRLNSYSHRRECWGFHPNSQEKDEDALRTAGRPAEVTGNSYPPAVAGQ